MSDSKFGEGNQVILTTTPPPPHIPSPVQMLPPFKGEAGSSEDTTDDGLTDEEREAHESYGG